MLSAQIVRGSCQVSPSLGELLVASAEALALGRTTSNETKKNRLILAGGWLFVEVQGYLRRIGHPTPDEVIDELAPRVLRVLAAKRELDEAIDRRVAGYRLRGERVGRDLAAWPDPSEDA